MLVLEYKTATTAVNSDPGNLSQHCTTSRLLFSPSPPSVSSLLLSQFDSFCLHFLAQADSRSLSTASCLLTCSQPPHDDQKQSGRVTSHGLFTRLCFYCTIRLVSLWSKTTERKGRCGRLTVRQSYKRQNQKHVCQSLWEESLKPLCGVRDSGRSGRGPELDKTQ